MSTFLIQVTVVRRCSIAHRAVDSSAFSAGSSGCKFQDSSPVVGWYKAKAAMLRYE
jgi:hypothetical protein